MKFTTIHEEEIETSLGNVLQLRVTAILDPIQFKHQNMLELPTVKIERKCHSEWIQVGTAKSLYKSASLLRQYADSISL